MRRRPVAAAGGASEGVGWQGGTASHRLPLRVLLRRMIVFALTLPTAIRISGGILNPYLWHAVRATWLRTGPPPPPIQLSDEEMDAWMEALGEGRSE